MCPLGVGKVLAATRQRQAQRRLRLAVCVSDWDILEHYDALAAARADWQPSLLRRRARSATP
jgi:hypothetical protein